MKQLLMIFALIIGMTACGSGDNGADARPSAKDRVEVIYFHGKQRCASCLAMEKYAKEVVNTIFADELKKGTIVFKTIDISSTYGEKIADRYEVTWSSLFINKWKDGKETRCNMTEFGFANARKKPDVFKKGISDKITQLLK